MDLLEYPKDPEQNMVWRRQLLSLAGERDEKGNYTEVALNVQRDITAIAKEDVFFFFNVLLWTYDPRPERNPADKPFITFDKQNDYLRWLERRYEDPYNISGFADKPRDVGCSWVTLGWTIWHWWKDEAFNAHLGSRVEDLVEKRGDPACLFFKADYMLAHLPPWFIPKLDLDEHHTHMLIRHPDKPGNTITGESANPNFGRGGRYSFLFMDEFGFWDFARAAWESSGESAHFRLAVTTPPTTGKMSHAWKLVSGQVGKIHVFRFNYSDVPWKDATWLLQARENKSMHEYNREVLRSYDVGMEGKVYAMEWSQVKSDDFLEYNPRLPLYLSIDPGLDGTALIWWQKDVRKNWNYILESYMNSNLHIDFYLPFMGLPIGSGFNYKPWELEIIKRHKEWKRPDGYFGDPDVKKRNMETGTPLKDYLAQAPRGIYVQTHEWTKDLNHYQIRETTKTFLKRCTVNMLRNQQLNDAMLSAHYPERRENSQSTSAPNKPVHDMSSHPRTALEYYVLNEPETEPEYTNTVHQAGAEPAEEVVGDDSLSYRSLHA